MTPQATAAAEGTPEQRVLTGSAAAGTAVEGSAGLDARERHLHDLLGSLD